ncbi:M16 family metallopeptidase [Criblamydia sequanensis]|uniref:Peptidase n=1 Tax=Candidatus Criblamydia sequanensis CRIB-18 TaxID=1437425 RepID=A0A090CYP7_9BACT|nr:insulinase family protein [Criblamydia sequanensis]CDR33666.1 Peptidase [Criblamydia sequanensis CRIB-18]
MISVKSLTIHFFVLLGLTFPSLKANECEDTFESEKSVDAIKNEKVTDLKLSNGMRVLLKKTDFDSDEFFIQMVAKGGALGLPESERPLANLSHETVWAAGLGDYSNDQLNSLMYRKGVELSSRIDKFSRVIEGNSTSEGAETLFNLIHLLFTKPNFSKESLSEVLKETIDASKLRHFDFENNFEDLSKSLNAPSFSGFQHPSLKNISKDISIEQIKNNYTKSVEDPGEWQTVIVGDFDLEEMTKLIHRYFENIPAKKNIVWPRYSQDAGNPSFPKDITRKKISNGKRGDSLTRMTFPIPFAINAENYNTVMGIIQLIEIHLRNKIQSEFKKTQGLDVSLEFPFFPYKDNLWLFVQFRSKPQDTERIETLVIQGIQDLAQIGPTEDELNLLKEQQTNTDELWMKHNCYWQANLMNYLLWGWDPKKFSKEDLFLNATPKMVQNWIEENINLKNYSILIASP